MPFRLLLFQFDAKHVAAGGQREVKATVLVSPPRSDRRDRSRRGRRRWGAGIWVPASLGLPQVNRPGAAMRDEDNTLDP